MSSAWLVFIVIFAGVYYIYMLRNIKAKKALADKFQAEHPEAAKVYLQVGMKGLGSEAVTVFGVNGNPPDFFFEGRKQGLFLLPGKSVLDVAYAWNRPGLLHKNVTTEVAPSKQEVEVEAGHQYRLSFDRDEEECVFDDITPAGNA